MGFCHVLTVCSHGYRSCEGIQRKVRTLGQAKLGRVRVYLKLTWKLDFDEHMKEGKGHGTELFIIPKGGNNPLSISSWKLGYLHKGILLVCKEECITDACSSTDAPRKHHANWEEAHTKGHVLCAFSYGKGPQLLHICTSTCPFLLFVFIHCIVLVGVQWLWLVFLQWQMVVSFFSFAYWSFVSPSL